MKKLPLILLCALSGSILMQCTVKETKPDKKNLAKNFVTPPDDARTWVFWFWLNGNISREGITADLEAMKRAGVGGALIMEVDQGAPLGPVAFMSDEWRSLFKFMLGEASRLGIEINMNNDAGWNGSGGPWVPLDQSMQTVVSSQVKVPAGTKFAGTLPKPPSVEGFYRDISVMAYPASADSVIRISEIVDLTGQMDPTGQLSWEAPVLKGSSAISWTILRLGHTFTGVKNHPAPAAGSGPECDKLSQEAIETHYNGMIGKLVKDAGQLAGKTYTATHVDSWENGPQNWTPKMKEEFKRRRGYDMTPYLPALAGHVVESADLSERFMRDARQTVSDLLAENYIGHLRTLANRDGLRLSMECYTTPGNDLDIGNYIDEPISEFWWPDAIYFWTNKAMSSLAHVNGRPVTGAEAFTSRDNERWLAHPANIKALGDKAFCAGVNRFIIHRYAMQPWKEDRRPGMTMGPWGIHFERTQTWWEDSKAWNEYVARCQYMLRQGTFVADILSLQSEEPKRRFQPVKISGYDYDGISPQGFLKNASVEDGLVAVPSGMKYRLLILPDDQEMSIALLEKISTLVEAGATILGTPPEKAPGLSGYPKSDEQIREMTQKLWGTANEADRKVGKGRVLKGMTPAEALALMGIEPDFSSGGTLNYIHRSVNGTEVYFVASPEEESTDIVCSFRVAGMKPEVWDPETGVMKPVSVFEEKDGSTCIPLHFKSSGSLFIVFSPGKGKEAERITSIRRDGIEQISFDVPEPVLKETPKAKPVEAIKTFTIAGWVKPGMEISLPEETHEGFPSVERNDVIFAAPGYELWSPRDAGAGISAGTNGICVTEHSAAYFPPVLVYATPITGWTHIAVVYQDNTPTLWINGKVARVGSKSPKTVHGSVGVVHMRSVLPFNGGLANLVQLPVALSEKEIDALMKIADTVSVNQQANAPAVNFMNREILKGGDYVITPAQGKTRQEVITIPDKIELNGPWQLSFTQGWGAPDQVTLDQLVSWSKHPDAGIRYYSGSGTYTKSFDYKLVEAGSSGLKSEVYLDLGKVAIMAEVHLNGKKLGTFWNPPFRINVTDCIRKGNNQLEIRVVNLMINRMIGDEQLPDDSDRNDNGTLKSWPRWLTDGKPSPAGRYTFTTWRLWKKNSTLQESGLIGPVTVQTVARF
ncbi:MAG: glycosyl hydrolase [Bacteroidales bacterium]|nr:glycosyl hydrolase [Bacteroidales bacterium]